MRRSAASFTRFTSISAMKFTARCVRKASGKSRGSYSWRLRCPNCRKNSLRNKPACNKPMRKSRKLQQA